MFRSLSPLKIVLEMIQHVLNGVLYEWDGMTWADRDGIKASAQLQHQLNREARQAIAAQDAMIIDLSEMTAMAQRCAEAGVADRAEAFAARALAADPTNEGRAATMISVLRKINRTVEALRYLEQYPNPRFSPLITTSAALLCDVGDVDRAEELLDRIPNREANEHVHAVRGRIEQLRGR